MNRSKKIEQGSASAQRSALTDSRQAMGQACARRLRWIKDPKRAVAIALALREGAQAWGKKTWSAWSDPAGLDPLRIALEIPGAGGQRLGFEGAAFERLWSAGDAVGGWLAFAKSTPEDGQAMKQGPLLASWNAVCIGSGVDRLGPAPRDVLREIQAKALELAIEGAKHAGLSASLSSLVAWEARSALACVGGRGIEGEAPFPFSDALGARVEFNPAALALLEGLGASLEATLIGEALAGRPVVALTPRSRL